MQDLISRQAAIDAIEHRLAEPAYQHGGEDWYTGMICAESELYDLPSAQPEIIPEIIYCKDCQHWDKCSTPRVPDEKEYHYCPMKDFNTAEDYFCAYGERRE